MMFLSPFTPTLFPPPSRGRVSLVFPHIPKRFFMKLLTIPQISVNGVSCCFISWHLYLPGYRQQKLTIKKSVRTEMQASLWGESYKVRQNKSRSFWKILFFVLTMGSTLVIFIQMRLEREADEANLRLSG
jgi:hypothetical protein